MNRPVKGEVNREMGGRYRFHANALTGDSRSNASFQKLYDL